MNCEAVLARQTAWLKDKCVQARTIGAVVNLSGGIDSAVVSTLCVRAGLDVVLLVQPGETNNPTGIALAHTHASWLQQQASKYGATVRVHTLGISNIVNAVKNLFPNMGELAYANLMSRVRMVVAYVVANDEKRLVVGTGNAIEDRLFGFFTKYGDGGVDISPIGMLTKSNVRKLGAFLGVDRRIVEAVPNDGLWADGRSDEDQLGVTYDDGEKYYRAVMTGSISTVDLPHETTELIQNLSSTTAHKMSMPPVCDIPQELLDEEEDLEPADAAA